MRLIDNSSVDGDSRAQMSIHPITDVLNLPLPAPILGNAVGDPLLERVGLGKRGQPVGAADHDTRLYRG